MHHFPFHIGDYLAATSHLSNDEDLAFRRILDMYYHTELPIPLDTKWVAKRLRISVEAIESVLQDLFVKHEDGYHHKRCEEEIAKYQGFTVSGKKGAEVRWGKDRGAIGGASGGDGVPIGCLSNPNSNREPRTKNREPRTKNLKPDESKAIVGAPLPTRFTDEALPKYWEEFCIAERPDISPQKTFDNFRDYWIAVPGQKGKKLDWTATWRNWVRNKKFEIIKSKAEPLNFTAANRRLLEKYDAEEKLIVKPLELGF